MTHVLLVGGLGYIGRYLSTGLAEAGVDVDICDVDPMRPTDLPVAFPKRYQGLSRAELAPYTTVLWFAGHSSVARSVADPDGSIRNNCLDLYDFARKLRDGTGLVYASTASLYSTLRADGLPHLATEEDKVVAHQNEYDISKFAFDYIAKTFLRDFTGLRLGTVSGYSDALRSELVFNGMNISAMREGIVNVSNEGAFRSILFLDDLLRVVLRLIDLADPTSGFLNTCSVNVRIGDLADQIATFHGAHVNHRPGGATYSFQMNNGRMRDLVGSVPRFTVEEHCRRFSEEFLAGRGNVR